MALKPTITLPGSPHQQVVGLGLALPSYSINFIGSKCWGSIELHFNAVYTRSLYNTNYQIGQSNTTNRNNILFFSAAPVWTVIQELRLAIDGGLTTNPPSTKQYLTNYAPLAAIILPIDYLDIGISYMRSAANMGIVISNTGSNASRSEIGFTWRF